MTFHAPPCRITNKKFRNFPKVKYFSNIVLSFLHCSSNDRFISHRKNIRDPRKRKFQLARALSLRHYLAASNISVFPDCALYSDISPAHQQKNGCVKVI